MKLLLCKNVESLGIVGDIVNVSAGYARNYLLPHGVATEPTDANVRRLAEARKIAERERAERRDRLEKLAEQIEGVEVTVRAKANEEGVLYGSVGAKEIVAALEDEGHYVLPDQIVLDAPIRHLDNVAVELRLAEGLRCGIKVWVVREKVEGQEDDEAGANERGHTAGTEAGADDDDTEA
jgi:large subunit ribosomal protein L9